MSTTWTPGDDSGSQTLTDDDSLYPAHVNELRTAVGAEHNADGTHGDITAESLDIGGTIQIDGVIDDDTMATASASTLATSESAKAYVDASIPTRLLSKTGSFSRDLTTASGTQAITGVGFQPTSIVLHAVIGNNVGSSHGAADSARNATGIFTNEAVPQGGLNSSAGANSILCLVSASSNFQTAVVTSYDADGFTLTWTKTSTPTGTAQISYIAYR